jgi:hypothetical protein
MGASLQAPLAALTAMMELTHSPGIIMPGMLVIVVASLTARELFGQESLFITMLKSNGLDYNTNPVMQTLRRMGVASVMNSNFIRINSQIHVNAAHHLLDRQPDWLLVDDDKRPSFIIPAVDLARALQAHIKQQDTHYMEAEDATLLDLTTIPAQRLEVAAVLLSATLQEALETLDENGCDALYVHRMTAPGIYRIYGLLTRGRVESAYRY